MSDEQIYVFQFSPIDNPPSRDMVYQVYTDDEKLMNRFLQQHHFIDGRKYVQVVNPKDADVDVAQELEVFRFGSNKDRSKIYEIVTSQHLVDEATIDTGSKLSFAASFNSALGSQDILMMEKILETIESLPLGYVLNIITEDEFQERREEIENNYKKINDSPSEYYIAEGLDDSGLFEALFEQSRVTGIQPITLESYIEIFVSLITDEYK